MDVGADAVTDVDGPAEPPDVMICTTCGTPAKTPEWLSDGRWSGDDGRRRQRLHAPADPVIGHVDDVGVTDAIPPVVSGRAGPPAAPGPGVAGGTRGPG